MFQEPHMRKIGALFGLVAVVALGAYTYATIKQTRYMYSGPVTISVTGKGEVTAVPDVASFSFSLEAKEADATAAQNKVNDQMAAIMKFLKEKGIEEKDIKTDGLSLTPWYEYPQSQPCTPWSCPPQGESVLKGHQVNQYVTVKVRDAGKTGEVLSGVAPLGAQNVSGLTFTIDDEEIYKAQARELAIADAKEKAKKLAKDLDVRLVRMSSFWEEMGGGYPMPYGMAAEMDMVKSARVESAPSDAVVPRGENTFIIQVSMTYEVK